MSKFLNLPLWIALLLSSIVLSIIGIYNGYPLFYSDTNAYILSGMHLDTPTTRPITYGLVILLTSFGGISLWPVILVQSLIVAFLLYCCLRYLVKSEPAPFLTVVMSVFLVLLTGISWVSTELIADIFTPVTILSLILLLVVKEISKLHLWFLYIIFFLANATHISHVAISISLLVSAFLLRNHSPLYRKLLTGRIGIIILLMVVGYFAMTSSVAKSRHIFLMAHFNEIRVLKPYLDAQCPVQDFRICKYKDNIPVDFIWDKQRSPIYQADIGWTESQEEFDRITMDILTTPKYLWPVVETSLKWTIKQLFSFRVGNGNHPFLEDSEMYETIAKYFPNETQTFLRSRQNTGRLLPVPVPDWIHQFVMLASVLMLVMMLSVSRLRTRVPKVLWIATVFIIISIIMNAFVCVTIVSVVDRFGCRVKWLLPMLVMLYASVFAQQLGSNQHSNEVNNG